MFTIYLAFQIVAAIHGTGRHRSDLSDANARTALMVRSVHRHCLQVANLLTVLVSLRASLRTRKLLAQSKLLDSHN